MKIIFQGEPKVGKTTLLEKIISKLINQNVSILGCLVKEILLEQERIGFEIIYIPEINSTILASSQEKLSDSFLGKYSVNIESIEQELIPFMESMAKDAKHDILIFDEIGRMQNMHPEFLNKINCILQKRQTILSTIVYDDEIWAIPYKNHPSFFLITVTISNRDILDELVFVMLQVKDFIDSLNTLELKSVIQLFNLFIAKGSIEELSELFQKTVLYLAKKRYHYDDKNQTYIIESDHRRYYIRLSNNAQYFACSCPFYLSHLTKKTFKQCSHIQLVGILDKMAHHNAECSTTLSKTYSFKDTRQYKLQRSYEKK